VKDTGLPINLAPEHKAGLTLANPVMPAAGCFGWGTEYAHLVKTEHLGAVVVGPITAGPRRGASPPRAVEIPGGVLIHTGLANPGISAVVRRYGRAWTRCPVPVLAHVAGTSPDATASCCHRLARVDAVAGIEIGLPDSAGPEDVCAIVKAAAATARQPIFVRLPLSSAAQLCEATVEAGANALTVGAPPRGAMWHEPSGRFVTGRLYGRFVLPLALHALRRVAERVAVPLIGCGGIHSVAEAQAALRAGATAVQIAGAVWRDPSRLSDIARALARPSEVDPPPGELAA
jgi:dihydroorotate dehydrogenase (NAD+) catalytic subunit